MREWSWAAAVAGREGEGGAECVPRAQRPTDANSLFTPAPLLRTPPPGPALPATPESANLWLVSPMGRCIRLRGAR